MKQTNRQIYWNWFLLSIFYGYQYLVRVYPNTFINEIRGKATPTPERARVPLLGMWPINILSTMLYVTLTSSAKKIGAAIRNICIGTLPFEKSPFFTPILECCAI